MPFFNPLPRDDLLWHKSGNTWIRGSWRRGESRRVYLFTM
jgi:hypothetical protein